MEPLVASARDIVEVVARRFHPEARTAWAQFSLPEFLLLTERLCRDVRREALRHIPAVRAIKLSHLLWVQRQNERYGTVAQSGWRMGFGLWRVVRAALNPLQAAGQETSGMFMEKTARVFSYRLRAYATRLLVLEIGRASIDLYAGRLRLSDEDMRAARERDMASIVDDPVRECAAASPAFPTVVWLSCKNSCLEHWHRWLLDERCGELQFLVIMVQCIGLVSLVPQQAFGSTPDWIVVDDSNTCFGQLVSSCPTPQLRVGSNQAEYV
jgi:hypothetical protein